jgi:predicted dehydrogenase
LIGCGRAAERLHVPALQASKHADLAAIADPNAERCAAIRSRVVPSCEVFSSIDELLQRVKPDGAIVATPVSTHVPVVEAALKAGVPVLLEKPMTASLEEAERLAATARASSAWLTMGFSRRYAPWAEPLGHLVQRHAGEPAHVESVFRIDPHEWNAHQERSDALDDLFCHQVDLLRAWFRRDVRELSARCVTSGEVEVELDLGDGVEARCVAGHGAPFRDETVVRFARVAYTVGAHSKHVRQELADAKPSLRVFLRDRSRRLRMALAFTRTPHDRQLAAFCDAIRRGRSTRPDLDDGLASVRAVGAARRSIADGGRRVAL